jgi:hypothetical protein
VGLLKEMLEVMQDVHPLLLVAAVAGLALLVETPQHLLVGMV